MDQIESKSAEREKKRKRKRKEKGKEKKKAKKKKLKNYYYFKLASAIHNRVKGSNNQTKTDDASSERHFRHITIGQLGMI